MALMDGFQRDAIVKTAKEKAKKDGEFVGSHHLSTKEFLTSVEIVDKDRPRLDPVTD